MGLGQTERKGKESKGRQEGRKEGRKDEYMTYELDGEEIPDELGFI